MKGYWGGIGLIVAVCVGVMASGGSERFKTESEYVSFCKNELRSAGLTDAQSGPACKCMYRNGRAAAEKRDAYELTDAEAEMFFDQCVSPVIAEVEANAAWNAEASDSSDSYVSGGWNVDDGSDWGID